jgi:Mg2+/Co2+ transporter CorB
MKNKTVGILFIVVAAILGLIIFLFNNALNKIVSETCSHGTTCPMYSTIAFNTYLSISIVIIVILAGFAFIFFFRDNQKQTKKIDESEYRTVMANLKEDERIVLKTIIANSGNIFQSDLVEKTNYPKVKITRILDHLESKDIIERKRRGMTNFVVLK